MKITGVFLLLFVSLCATAADFYEASISYMDNLKTCRPSTVTIPPISGGFPAAASTFIISGKKNEKCAVKIIQSVHPGQPPFVTSCEFTQGTIQLLTNQEQYSKMKEKRVSFSTGDPVSQKMSQECVPVNNANQGNGGSLPTGANIGNGSPNINSPMSSVFNCKFGVIKGNNSARGKAKSKEECLANSKANEARVSAKMPGSGWQCYYNDELLYRVEPTN